MTTFDWQPIATVAASVVGVLIAASIPYLNRADNTLGKAERLSTVADSMGDSSKRELVCELRDSYVVDWSLQRIAPRLPLSNGVATVFYVIGGLAFLSFVLLASDSRAQPPTGGTWILYGVTVMSISVAQITRAYVLESRDTWVAEERKRRGLPAPASDHEQKVKVSFTRAVMRANPLGALSARTIKRFLRRP
jgi:hypothetical protein